MGQGSGFAPTVEIPAANVYGATAAAKLLREDDEAVYGDSVYLGLEKRDKIKNNLQISTITHWISRHPGWLPRVSDSAIDLKRHIENHKSDNL